MIIRQAGKADIDGLLALLHEVLELHAKEYPNIFISGTTKYSREELRQLIEEDEKTMIFVAEEDKKVIGHAFLKLIDNPGKHLSLEGSLYRRHLCGRSREG